ncbi:hypothetical protein HHL21_17860 [Massilia sp. RP-1-19]|uniref:Uncharacterized protein n=1 Tax=Massilia polaris TaxID=2728846 RepID=A0A848HS14_9BURK|nr:hypothetical protein [Massilia polaris]NML62910.1 hypothetical protein [Massilia polaris]
MEVPVNGGLATTYPAGSEAANAPGVSWGAVFAGATAAAALSFILLILGVGLGLSSVSPYSYTDQPIGGASVAYIAFMSLAASAIGGYIAGRLRVKWTNVHTDEVHFRDTAHGLLAWAVATLVTVALLTGGVRAVMSGAIDSAAAIGDVAAPVAAAAAGAAANDGDTSGPVDYFSDMMLRSATGESATGAQRAEVNKIIASAITTGSLSADDRTYLAQLIARRTGVTQADAERRVDEVYGRAAKAAADAKAKAKQVADDARKAGAKASLWMFVALLLGAFTASLAATFGGRNRDDERVIARSTN